MDQHPSDDAEQANVTDGKNHKERTPRRGGPGNRQHDDLVSDIPKGERPSMSKLLQCSLPSTLGNSKKRPLNESAPRRLKIARCDGSRSSDEPIPVVDSVSRAAGGFTSDVTSDQSDDHTECRISSSSESEHVQMSSASLQVGHINNLPHSLLLQIFINLSLPDLLHRASLTCKFWYALVYDPELWRDINVRGQTKVEDDVLQRLTTYSDNVRILDISYLTMITSDGVARTLAHLPHLQALDMRR